MAVELIVHQIDKQPRKRLQKARRGGRGHERGKGGESEETKAKSQKGSQLNSVLLRIPTGSVTLLTVIVDLIAIKPSDIHNDVCNSAYLHLSYHGYYDLVIGSKPPAAATKGKSTSNIKKSNPTIEVEDSDESSSLSSLQSDDKSNGSDEDDEDDDDYDVARMTDREARQMFNNEVLFPRSSFYL